MKVIVLLLVSFVSEGLGRYGPLSMPNNGIDVKTKCPLYVQNYHICRATNINRPISLKAELKQNLTTSLQKCFTDNGCTQQQQQPKAETPEETKCRQSVRDARREKVRQCVHEKYPEYVFAQPNDQHDQKEAQHHKSLLDINTDQCTNKEAVVECKRNAIQTYRRAQFLMKCSAKGGCLATMPEDCQDYLLEVQNAKCWCKAQVQDQIRSQIPECQQVPHKPRKHLACPPNGYCRAGYEYWLKDHPLEHKVQPAKSLLSLARAGAQVAPAQTPQAPPAVPKPAPPQPPAIPQQPAAPLPQQAAQPAAHA